MIRQGRTAGEDGSVTLELTVLGPALLLVLGLVVVAARIEAAAAVVEHAAAAGARAASVARTAAAAEQAASRTVRENLTGQGVQCRSLRVAVDTAGFHRPVGADAQVSVSVGCAIALADQGVPGLPGSRQVDATAVSVLDTYRAR